MTAGLSVTVTRTTVSLDPGPAAPAGVRALEADVFHPDPSQLTDRPAAVVCLPGGGMSRRYFDLDVPPEVGTYSMARYMAERGLLVVTVDHPGVGGSDRPDDGYALTSRVVADVDGHAIREALDRARAGTLLPDVPPLPGLHAVGLGHSMGAYVAAVQQTRRRTYDQMVLLGFSPCGLPAFLTEEELRHAGDPEGLRRAIADLVAARFGNPLPGGSSTSTSGLLMRGEQPPEVLAAVAAASAPLLALVGFTTMFPGSSAEELAALDVPLFLGVGGEDITGDPRVIPAALPGCDDITLFVLPGSGHNHNVDRNRTRLWERIVRWVQCRP